MIFDKVINSYGFIKNKDEPHAYKKISGRVITFLVLCVDDILLIGNDVHMLSSMKLWLLKNFSMKDLEETTYIVRIYMYRYRLRRLLRLSQSIYVNNIFKRFGFENSTKKFHINETWFRYLRRNCL